MNAVLALIALATIGAAVAALSRRNLLHSVLLFAGSWAGVAAFYLWAGAEFVAFAQVIVYIGAISMAVLFAVLLTRHARDDVAPVRESRRRALYAVIAGIAVAAVLLSAVSDAPLGVASGRVRAVSVRQIGELLMGTHAAALLVVGALLTVALLGAVVLAAGDPPEEKEESP